MLDINYRLLTVGSGKILNNSEISFGKKVGEACLDVISDKTRPIVDAAEELLSAWENKFDFYHLSNGNNVAKNFENFAAKHKHVKLDPESKQIYLHLPIDEKTNLSLRRPPAGEKSNLFLVIEKKGNSTSNAQKILINSKEPVEKASAVTHSLYGADRPQYTIWGPSAKSSATEVVKTPPPPTFYSRAEIRDNKLLNEKVLHYLNYFFV